MMMFFPHLVSVISAIAFCLVPCVFTAEGTKGCQKVKECVDLFSYDGVEYNGCATTSGNGECWCSTGADPIDANAVIHRCITDGDFPTPFPPSASHVNYGCGQLKVDGGKSIMGGTPRSRKVPIACDDQSSSYYETAICMANGYFDPPSIICSDKYPDVSEPFAEKYQGQFFEVVPLTADKTFNAANETCRERKGVLATAITTAVMNHIASKIQDGTTYIGLAQEKKRGGKLEENWRWIDTDTDNVLPIDGAPVSEWHVDAFKNDIYILNKTCPECDGGTKNVAAIIKQGGILQGVKDVSKDKESGNVYTLCQITYPAYHFKVNMKEKKGPPGTISSRMTLINVDLEECVQKCLFNEFCRSFSYSSKARTCHQHTHLIAEDELVVAIETEDSPAFDYYS